MAHEEKRSTIDSDEAFVARFRASWGRPEMTPSEAVAFTARLERRLQHGPRPLRLVPALVGVGVACALVALVWGGPRSRPATDDDFLASLEEADAVAQNVVVKADGTSQDVAYADVADGLWTVLDDDAQDGLSGRLSGEYEALATLVFADKASATDSAARSIDAAPASPGQKQEERQ